MESFTEREAMDRRKMADAIEADSETFPAMLFATLRTNGNLPQAQKELKKWCMQLGDYEHLRIAAYGIHVPQHMGPHAHVLLTGFNAETGRTLEDIKTEKLLHYQNLWPRGAKLERLISQRKVIDYLIDPRNAQITGFDILMFDQRLVDQFRKGKKLPENVARRRSGLPLVDPAQGNPSIHGQLKARLKMLKKKNGNIIEITQLQHRLDQLKAS